MLQWISSFLHDRTQCTKVGNCQSSLSKVISISGVPQGSVLGPLLFLLFINDLPSLFGDRMTVKMFADDVKIYLVVGDIGSSSVLQCGLGALFDWSLKWQLSVSAKKCLMLQLGHSNKHFKGVTPTNFFLFQLTNELCTSFTKVVIILFLSKAVFIKRTLLFQYFVLKIEPP